MICPLCHDVVDKLVYRFHYDTEQTVINKIKAEFPEWTKGDGICSRCRDFFHSEIILEQRILPSIGPHFPIKTVDDFIVIPTGLRINANPGFTGKGVTICFIDSGFYPHPDLVATKKRIKIIVDIAEASEASPSDKDLEAAWHGTMTTVVCAGDGYLSKGLYKGIASDAELVLLKVQDKRGKITTVNLVKALTWVLQNHEEYNIRIVNISLAADEAIASYKESDVDQLAEKLVEQGIVVVAAVGNDINAAIRPPANSLSVVAVGGVDDGNLLEGTSTTLYHSSYGKTIDELTKPDLIAHAIWIAAPVLPGTPEDREAGSLYQLVKKDDGELLEGLQKFAGDVRLDSETYESTDARFVRQKLLQRIRHAKYICPHYMHVDGTSFAAPIVSSVVAQLLETDPGLTSSEVRKIIFSTASRVKELPPERQGFGTIQPRKAVIKALKRTNIPKPASSPHIDHEKNTIGFYVQHDCASQISVAGSFNNWSQDVWLMEAGKNGLWQLEIPMLPAGRYQYKFFVDEKIWIEDFDNPYREPDGFNGFNSLLIIEPN